MPVFCRRQLLPMARRKDFKVGDHVQWNSEAGRVRGTIVKKVARPLQFKGYTVRASLDEPQYQIQSDKTGHLAMHRGSGLEEAAAAQTPSAARQLIAGLIWRCYAQL